MKFNLPNRLISFCFLLLVVFSFKTTDVRAEEDESREALRNIVKSVKQYTLPNGIRVIIYPRKDIAPVFSGAVVTRVGGVDEALGATGISHMFEHMAFKGTHVIGTKNYKKEKPLLKRQEELKSFVSELERKLALKDKGHLSGASLKLVNSKLIKAKQALDGVEGALKKLWKSNELDVLFTRYGVDQRSYNATTDKDFTKYFESMPKSSFEFWCWVESERLLKPVFRQFYKERDVVLEERRKRYEDSGPGKLYENMLKVNFLTHPYRNPVIGYENDIRSLTPSMLRDFHKKYYVGSNLTIGLVGDIDSEEDIKTIAKYFGRVPKGKVPQRTTVVEKPQESERRIILELDKSSLLLLGYKKPVYPDIDDAPITVMGEILVGGRLSRFYEQLVKKQQIATSVSYSEGPGIAFPNLFYFYVVPKGKFNVQRTVNAIDKIIEKFRKEGPTDDELTFAKRRLAMEYVADLGSNASLAANIATSKLLYNDWAAFIRWYDQMTDVSKEDILRIAKKYLTKKNRTIGAIVSK